MAALWHPDAQRISFGGIGGFSGGGKKIVWHTVEGSTIEGAVAAYRASGAYPHFTVQWVNGKLRIAQHAPINACVTTLKHPPGTPETNRANCIQIEIADFAKNAANWSAGMYAALADLARWIEANAGVPRRCGVRFAVPATRLSGSAFYAYAGHIGHEHVPGNDHWDPGAMKIEKIVGDQIPTHEYASRHLDPGEVGTDVEKLQKAVNKHRTYRRKHKLGTAKNIEADGHYGGQTEAAAKRTAYQLGASKRSLQKPGTSRRHQKYIANPDKRPRSWKRRQRKRRDS